jgi:hypothetical protein
LLPWQAQLEFHVRNEDVREAFRRLIKLRNLYDKRCFCFLIDGLDEYEETRREDYKDMVDLLHSWTKSAPDDVKICVSSRDYNVFLNRFSPEKRLRLQDLTRRDMQQYVEDKLGEIADAKKRSELVGAIVEKADGIFFWVALVVRALRTRMEDSIDFAILKQELDTLPDELNSLFEYLLNSVARHTRRKIYQLSTMIDRLQKDDTGLPLLAVSFLDDYHSDPAFAMQPVFQFSGLDQETLKTRHDTARKRLNGYCKGLLEVKVADAWTSRSASVVSYTHRSVSEFLQTKRLETDAAVDLRSFDVEAALSQLILAELRATLNDQSSNTRELSFAVFKIMEMRSQRELDQAPFTFLECLGSTVPDNGYSPHTRRYIQRSRNWMTWSGHGKAVYITDPLFITAYFGYGEYAVWKARHGYSTLANNNSKLVIFLTWLSCKLDVTISEHRIYPLHNIALPDVYDVLLEQGLCPQTMLHGIYWGGRRQSVDMTVWEYFITQCIKASLPERATREVFQKLGKTMQKFLECRADPNLLVICRLTETQQSKFDKSEGVSIEVLYRSEGRRLQLDTNNDWFRPSDRTRQFIFTNAKDRDISIAELIQFWNFDNGDAILQLMDKTVNPEEQSKRVFAEGNVKGGIRIENSDGKAMLLTKGVETAEFIPDLNAAVEKPKLVEAESVATKDWIGAVAQSLQPTHIMAFFSGRLDTSVRLSHF